MQRHLVGAVLLISQQLASRILTFIVNQILVRYLQPERLGISTQLELYSITVLFFSRESLRVALQRQADIVDSVSTEDNKKAPKSHVNSRTSAGRSQAIVNLAYISISLGVISAIGFGWIYLKTLAARDVTVLETPFLRESLAIYGVAAVWELLAEPCYVIAQQKAKFEVRAAAESVATVLRCFITCGTQIWASRTRSDIGVLPFALGQGAYALSLSIVYYWKIWSISSTGAYSLMPSRIYSSDSTLYIFSYFSRPLLSLSLTFFGQSIFKHLLTQGDTFIITSFASVGDQGTYALASNYGGLIARLILQPVEEVSRNHFGKALSSVNGTPSKEDIVESRDQLLKLLRIYVLVSVCIVSVGPTIAPFLLQIIAGSRSQWLSAGPVLATYCYYIPLLAINGLTEAFVSSVATESELHRQTLWMISFFIAFGSAAFAFLRVLNLGAEGLVWANGLNMVFRITWAVLFVQDYLKRYGVVLGLRKLLPHPLTIAAGVATYAVLTQLKSNFSDGTTFSDSIADLLKSGVVAVVFVSVILLSERAFFLECYRTIRNPRQ